MAFQIVLNTNDSAHSEIAAELRQQLSALETVQFEDRSQPAPSGTLGVPGLEQVTAFIIEHPDKMVSLTIAVVNLLNSILARFPRRDDEDNKKQRPRAVVVVNEQQLPFPSSQNQQDKFLKAIESDEQSTKAR